VALNAANMAMAQTIASNEADIATIIRRTLGNIPPRRTPTRDPERSTRHLGWRSSRGQILRSDFTIHVSGTRLAVTWHRADVANWPTTALGQRTAGSINSGDVNLAESLKNQSQK
jgi:hypothetical protein